ncbi:DUF421 domain-containing protein [Sandaracinus amylolyticus]|uniref:DUF421 domain-containing protein n=1 Tax=Sandaracinus amylolyticus TaxID=927083 RepID=UPI001F1FB4A4|nr:YetF domain-containing protein [Sandaracinus amylolyticus]UJR78986.1 Hypothetical protein I5071_10190 [Sandaracinus amylolyticus]
MDTVFRVAIIYVVLFVAFRVMGKRELGSLTPFELVTLMIVPEIVSESLHDGDHSLTNAAIGVMTLFLLVFATSVITHRFPRAAKVLESHPTVLVSEGKIVEDAMNLERVSVEDLFGEMHKAGVARVEDVRWAILEGDGRIAIIARDRTPAGARPTARDEVLT